MSRSDRLRAATSYVQRDSTCLGCLLGGRRLLVPGPSPFAAGRGRDLWLMKAQGRVSAPLRPVYRDPAGVSRARNFDL